MVQALGLQHGAAKSADGPEEKARKRNLFWTIYTTEKTLSLHLGRSSSFRDQDITIPRHGSDLPSDSFLSELTPIWISMASIQGRVYEEIYSTGALMRPPRVRAYRALALAAELKAVMQQSQEVHVSCCQADMTY